MGVRPVYDYLGRGNYCNRCNGSGVSLQGELRLASEMRGSLIGDMKEKNQTLPHERLTMAWKGRASYLVYGEKN